MATSENCQLLNPFGSSSSSIADQPSSPYFLNGRENPGTILVSQLLSTNNYPTWSRSMTNTLGFVERSIAKPLDLDSPLFQAWWRCNNMVLKQEILSSIDVSSTLSRI